MATSEFLYNQSKKNIPLRRKMDTEMFINRSISQEAAYDYIINKEKSIKRNSCSLILIGIIIMFLIYIGVLVFK